MHWTAVIEKTENQLWKRSACILRVTKLHTLANIVLQKSNILLEGEKKKDGKEEEAASTIWWKELSWVERQSTPLVLKCL